MPPMNYPRFAVCVMLATSAVFAQDDGIDLLADLRFWARHEIPLYLPQVEPQVTCLRSDEDARQFSLAAWGEDKKELHVDFQNEQVLVIAWGPLRCDQSSSGLAIRMLCEQLRLEADGLKVRLRTVLPPGPGIDVALDSPATGLTSYPAQFLRTPRTERVEVDIVGSRRRDPKIDLQPVASEALVVRIHADETPAREQVLLLGGSDTVDQPQVTFTERNGKSLLDIAWGKLGPGSYQLDLIGASLQDGELHATVRAEQRPIMVYSGPGKHHPSLRLQLPPVKAVRLHIVRAGEPLAEGEADFTAVKSDRLVVTVDREQVRARAGRK
ncbi:MAG: hypothetical protein KF830_12440 [Planctomycetes bacterium]|nr:hypothetical protein [Planctomycetota bacterium]